jgi:ketosteroid isomerase-like protein
MGTDRAKIEAAYAELLRIGEVGDANAFTNLFAEDCSFVNPMLPEPIRGRETLRKLTAQWPKFVNQPEWVVIEGNRLVVGWNERQVVQGVESSSYRGISTWVFNDDGLVESYEGFFDPATTPAATASE